MANHKKSLNGKPILRDYLATDRTILANERTLLAYLRTALTLFVVGATFIKFFGSWFLELVGWIFIPSALFIFGIGAKRYWKTDSIIKVVENNGFHTPNQPLP